MLSSVFFVKRDTIIHHTLQYKIYPYSLSLIYFSSDGNCDMGCGSCIGERDVLEKMTVRDGYERVLTSQKIADPMRAQPNPSCANRKLVLHVAPRVTCTIPYLGM